MQTGGQTAGKTLLHIVCDLHEPEGTDEVRTEMVCLKGWPIGLQAVKCEKAS